ncbi:hypothetical protein HPB51_012761 [Rhipicephalus microplus]|uniref:Uncharacterized protein n=1 Tax=Rhipicephalus microplus TaxID=6941 RepID=A0A9J6EA03_RHIMP|nr:hypothetical protein HPB51_012761 [Rhipicephalus microplus]
MRQKPFRKPARATSETEPSRSSYGRTANCRKRASARGSINLEATKDLLLLYETLMDVEEQRNLLCEDQMLLNFLVYVLQETTDDIVMLSLKASSHVLAALCADDDRCTTVSQTFGLSPSLEQLTSGGHNYGIKEAALRLKMRLLEARVALLSRQQEEAAWADVRLSFRDYCSAGKDSSCTAAVPSPAKCPPFLGQHNGAAKVVSLHIEGLFSEPSAEYTGLDGDEASRITEEEKDEHDRENLPAYLPEVDSPIREDAVVRQKKPKSSSATSWLSSAATFITKSLYW